MVAYFGFAISSTMFAGEYLIITRREIAFNSKVKAQIESSEMCFNPSHEATIEALKIKFNLELEIPEKPPIINLKGEDILIVAQITGLPRLVSRHEYTDSEIAEARIKFVKYEVHELANEPVVFENY